MFVLVRQSPKAQGTALRFASRPVSGDRADVDRWRDEHNGRLSAGALKREGKVASAVLSDELLAEYEAFRGAHAGWRPLACPPTLREAQLVPQDADISSLSVAAAADDDDDDYHPLPQTDDGGYPRQPALRGNQLVFASEGDLWVGEVADESLSGAAAAAPVRCSRLTADGGCAFPAWSPDGRWLAFSRHVDDRASEVFVMQYPSGGAPRRLTYLGDGCEVVGWSEDGRAVRFRTAAQQPMRHHIHLWEAPLDGGRPKPLNLGPAHDLVTLGGGAVLLGRRTVEPRHSQWKQYGGGGGGELWIRPAAGAPFRRLSPPEGVRNAGHPIVHGGRLYFSSDHLGVSNIFSVPLGPAAAAAPPRQHTFHDPLGVREPSLATLADGGGAGSVIVYHAGAEIHLLVLPAADAADGGTGTVVAVPTQKFGAARASANVQLDIADELTEFAIHPEGHSLLAVVRGRLLCLSGLWEGPAVPLGAAHGVRYACAAYLHDGRAIAAACDFGDWRLDVLSVERGAAATAVPVRRAELLSEPLEIAPSPTEAVVAVATHDLKLLLVDVRSGTIDQLDAAKEDGGVFDIAWSADGAWIAYAVSTATGANASAIRLCEVRTRRVVAVTSGAYRDCSPSWDPMAKYVAFLSARHLRAVEDDVTMGFAFPEATCICIATLLDSTPDPLLRPPRPPGWSADDEADEAAGSGSDSEADDVPDVRVHGGGISRRVRVLPMRPARLESLQVLDDDRLIYLRLDAPPRLRASGADAGGDDGDDEQGTMVRYDLRTRRAVNLIDHVLEYTLSADGRTVCCLVDEGGGGPLELRAHEAGVRPAETDDDDNDIDADTPGELSGLVDLEARACLELDAAAEWRQLFYEGWAATLRRAHPRCLAAVDGAAVLDAYEPLLAKVASIGELHDLMHGMQTELGASHAWVAPAEGDDATDGQQGYLGATTEWDDAAAVWRVARLVRGAAGDPDGAAPLARPGAILKEGDALLAINHTPLSKSRPPEVALALLAGKEIYLTIGGGGGGGAGPSDYRGGGGGGGRRGGGKGKAVARDDDDDDDDDDGRGGGGGAGARGGAGRAAAAAGGRCACAWRGRRRRGGCTT